MTLMLLLPFFSESRGAVHPSWDSIRDSERAEDHALRRALDSRRRRRFV